MVALLGGVEVLQQYCPRCKQSNDPIAFGGNQIVHLDCQSLRERNYEARALVSKLAESTPSLRAPCHQRSGQRDSPPTSAERPSGYADDPRAVVDWLLNQRR